MEINYKLYRIREMAEGDEDFVKELVSAFLQEIPEDMFHLKEAVLEFNNTQIKYYAHKMKPTIDLFETGLLEDIIELEKMGNSTGNNSEIQTIFLKVITQLELVIAEMKLDFNIA
ncbi:MAG: Hpt domain-containing protein [Flavobacteriales bacterium CG_4_9_14_3_um_filter_40_17]|nr:MAG: Hpt domain-containing protein [Flavobacteriales bacterium CG_4_9_14_3_um_filter_40_17]